MPPKSKGLTRSTTTSSGPWSPARILNSSSPIASKDLHAFLVTCISGWDDDYDESQKRAIIDSLPPRYRKREIDVSGRLIWPLPPDFVLEDAYVKSAIPKFKNDLGKGLYEKGWQKQARKAMQDRHEGKFDAYLQEKREREFGGGGKDTPDTRSDGCQIDSDSSDTEWTTENAKSKQKRRGQRGQHQSK